MRPHQIAFVGTLADPESRRYCLIFDAAAVLFGGELLGGLFGAGEVAAGAGALGAGEAALGAGAGAALGEGAALTLPEVLVGASAPTALGGAEALTLGGAAGAGAAGADLALGGAGDALTTGASGLDFAMGGAGGVPGGITTGAGGGLPAVGGPLTVEPLAGSAIPAAASPGAPGAIAGVAPVPAGIAPEAAATGQFDPFLGMNTIPGENLGAASATGGGGGGVTASSSGGGLTSGFDKAVGSLTGGALNSKDLGLAASVGGLGMNLLNRNQPIPGEKQINQAAGSLTATAGAQANKGLELESFINSGALPPGLASGLKTATTAAEANIKSGYAARGMTGSSAEAQDIQAAHDRAQNAAAQIALQLLQHGSSMVGQAVNTESLAANIYQSIMAHSLAEDQALGDSIGKFAAALAGAGGGGSNTITLKAA